MLEYFQNLNEVKNFGLNSLIISSVFTIILSAFQGWGLLQQNKTIWRKKSGESVPTIMTLYSGAYFFMFIVYGYYQNSIAMMLNGCLGFVYIPIVAGLYKFKGLKPFDWVCLSLFLLLSPAMAIVDFKDLFFLITLSGIIISLILLPVEMLWTKSPGALEPKFMLVFMTTNVFWFIYAFAIDNWVLKIFNPISFVLFIVSLLLWKHYDRKKKIEAESKKFKRIF